MSPPAPSPQPPALPYLKQVCYVRLFNKLHNSKNSRYLLLRYQAITIYNRQSYIHNIALIYNYLFNFFKKMYIKPSDEFFVLGDKHPRAVSPSTSFPGLQVCRAPWERGCFLLISFCLWEMSSCVVVR